MKDALAAATSQFNDAPLFVPKEKESLGAAFFTTLLSTILEVVAIFFPEEMLLEHFLETYVKDVAEDFTKATMALIEVSAALVRYGGEGG